MRDSKSIRHIMAAEPRLINAKLKQNWLHQPKTKSNQKHLRMFSSGSAFVYHLTSRTHLAHRVNSPGFLFWLVRTQLARLFITR